MWDVVMKKNEMIDQVAAASGQPKVLVRSVLDATTNVVRKALLRHEPVLLLGLGKIFVLHRGERRARNIHTGEQVIVPPRTVAHLTPSSGLLKALNAK